ncbi:hypothetical protein BKI52_14580 [marine bacterium AO1-C]|nr:hypothetical protein BKI52_14580 [marine bacterium AO1-C]
MFKNYLKITLRNLWRNKLYAVINVLGLAVGLICAVLLYLYIQDELSFDQYHQNAENIYRIESDLQYADKSLNLAVVPGLLAPELQKKNAGVMQTARISDLEPKILKINKQKFHQKGLFYADPSIFNVLAFKPVAGNLSKALVAPYSIVLTKTLAAKIFASPKAALGKTIILDDDVRYTIKGVIEDAPTNSHFQPQALISISTYKKTSKYFEKWNSSNTVVYVKLKPKVDPKTVETSLEAIYRQYMYNKKYNAKRAMYLRPVTDIHLYSKVDEDYAITGNIQVVHIFIAIAVLILLIACANYMNLATARSVERAKEVGIRKVVGSHRGQLIQQFLTEAVLLSFLAFLLSLSLLEFILPGFNRLTGKELAMHYTSQPQRIIGLLLITIFTGLISGSFPAFMLSRFKPYQVLKGKFSHSKRGNRVRKGLVVFQFCISMIMIVGTLTVYRQMQYVKSKSHGFDKEQVLSLSIMEDYALEKFPVLQQKLLQSPGIVAVSGTSSSIADNSFNESGMTIEQANGEQQRYAVQHYFVDQNYLKAMGMNLTKGRNFSPTRASDYEKAMIVNEAMVKKLGWKKPIGKRINYGPGKKRQAKVIGVVKDFHLESLYKPIAPIALRFIPADHSETYYAHLKIRPENLSQTLTYVKKAWQEVYPNYPYNGEFLDQRFAQAYQADQKRGQTFLVFSILAVLIACLGLFGLASFTARQRVKEIGIRKVLGASIPQILALLSSGFVRLVAISSVIAFPMAYYLMNQWLQNFAYRTGIHWSVFVLAGVATLLVTLLTISVQSLRVARVNPVQVLKDE